MRAAPTVVILLLCLAEAHAAALIVRKDGSSVWATTARREQDTVVYISRDTGDEKRVAVTELDGVIPVVKRGLQYTPEKIQKYVERIRKVRTRHPRLLRQLNPILQEWEALQEPSPEFDDEIAAIVDRFEKSERDAPAFRKARLDLDMIKYKDVQGAYASRVDDIIEQARSEYVATNMVRLVELARSKAMSVNTFIALRDLARDLLEATGGEESTRVREILERSRETGLDVNCRYAASSFASRGKTINAYLHSSRVLFLVRDEIASTDPVRSEVEHRISGLRQQAAAALPDCNFGWNGYPLTQEDLGILRGTKRRSSTVSFTSLTVDEQCLVFPRQQPRDLRFRRPIRVPVRLVFNREQPSDRTFGLVAMFGGKHGMHSHTVKLPPPRIVKGHWDLTFSYDFSELHPDFVLHGDDRGNKWFYVYLVWFDESRPDGEEWSPMSFACSWPLH